MKSITLHDVAEAAGVSLITASRALGNPDRVSKATIAKVEEAVRATGYIPNRLAGGLKSRRSMTVAALVPVISVPQFLPTIQALTQDLEQAGYQLILGQMGYDRAREMALVETMVGRRVDAIVVTGLLSPATAARLRKLALPVVETWDLGESPVDMMVGFSHRQVGHAVAEYFRARGWLRVGLATGDDQRAALRRDGFLAAMGGEVPVATVPAPANLASGRRACAQLLARDPGLRAIFCSSDAMAEGVLTEARARGLEVPGQLAVCGFGGADFAAHLMPSLTTVQVEGERIGHQAASLVLQRCRGQEPQARVMDVGFRIVERASTAG